MEKKSSWGHGAARLGQRLFILAQNAHGRANLVFGHSDNVVHVGAYVFKINRADALRAKPVGQRLRNLLGREGDDVPRPKAGLRVRGKLRLDANHSYFGIAELNGSRNAADQSSTANWNQHSFNGAQIVKDFKSNRSLASNNFLVIVWRYDYIPVLGSQFFGAQSALFTARTDDDDLCSESGGGLELILRSIAWHHDDGLHPKRPRRVGHALPVIATGIRDDAAAPVVLAK